MRAESVIKIKRITLWERLHIDVWLLFWLMLIAGASLFILYSASDLSVARVERQMLHFGIGFAVMFAVAQTPPKLWLALIPIVYVASLVLLILVYIIGTESNGAKRWIALPGFGQFQPSELAKIALPIAVAGFLSYRELPPKWGSVILSLVIITVPTLLIMMQPDLGTSIMISLSGLYCLFFAGLSWRIIMGTLIMMIPAAFGMFFFVLKEYQQQRVLTLINPGSDKLGAGWNILQSKTAIGSGGIDGKGWLEGTQSKLDFLPEAHTDFIFAVIAEEFGLIGVVVLLLLYTCLLIRCMMISFRAANIFLRILGSAITMIFSTYILVNIAMVSGIFPIVGVPLPLISYGGTSVVSLFIGFGLLMRVATHHRKF
ncbi:MAG: rod shape-determining protein RodA [Pseudomonadota bacterium]|nr:rod shape-determining protein RodA [Pseudomonadota bacterium]